MLSRGLYRTFKGLMKGLDGKIIPPTNKKFHREFCTVAHWKNEKIDEERERHTHSCMTWWEC
jgi:hypothetical protein